MVVHGDLNVSSRKWQLRVHLVVERGRREGLAVVGIGGDRDFDPVLGDLELEVVQLPGLERRRVGNLRGPVHRVDVVFENMDAAREDLGVVAKIREVHLDGVLRDDGAFVVALDGVPGHGNGILGDGEGHPPVQRAQQVDGGIEHNLAGAVGKIEGLPDSVTVLAVVLRRGPDEQVVARDVGRRIAHQCVAVGPDVRRRAGPAQGNDGHADAHCARRRERVVHSPRAPIHRVELASAAAPRGGSVERVAKRGRCEAAPRLPELGRRRARIR